MLLLPLSAACRTSGLEILHLFLLLFHACTSGIDAYSSVSFTFVEWAGAMVLGTCDHIPGLLRAF